MSDRQQDFDFDKPLPPRRNLKQSDDEEDDDNDDLPPVNERPRKIGQDSPLINRKNFEQQQRQEGDYYQRRPQYETRVGGRGNRPQQQQLDREEEQQQQQQQQQDNQRYQRTRNNIQTAPRPLVAPDFAGLEMPNRYGKDKKLGFQIYASGQIDFGEFHDQNGMCVKYDLVHGESWSILTGIQSGISQHSYKSSQQNSRVVWNFPFQVGYCSTSPKGWPKMVLSCFGRDGKGRAVMKAYGSTHIPLFPGTHTRYVYMFVPIQASLIGKFFGWWSGKQAEYVDPIKTVGHGQGREVTRVKSGGIIKITVMVQQIGMEKFGYNI